MTDVPVSTSPQQGWWPLRLPRMLVSLLWVIVAVLGVTALMRIFAWDDFQPFAIADSLTIVFFLPAWIVLLLAALGRRPGLGGVALCIVLAQLAFLSPELLASQPLPPWAATARSIKLFDANVYNDNPSMTGFAAAITADRPELVTLEEATPRNQARLQEAGAFRGLPFRFVVDEWNPFAFEIASAFPIGATHVISAFGEPLMVQARINSPFGVFELWVVHTEAPLAGDFSHWRLELADIAARAQAHRGLPLLVTGDFNATWGNRGFRSILSAGLVDAAAARGDALDMTWSQTMGPIPPLTRIDHVLTGAGLAVRSIRAMPGPGSDHRSLEATVLLHRSIG